MPLIVITLLAMAVNAVPAAAAGSIFGPNPVPDWVKTAARQKLPVFPGSPKAVVLLDEMTYTVGADGRAVEHERYVVKILRPQGRECGYTAVWFDKDSKVLSMHVWSIDTAGHEYSLKDDETMETGHPGEGGQLYDDEKAKVANIPGRDSGGVIAYEYERCERPYLAETNWGFQDELPRISQSFTLVLPENYTYTTTWAHHAKVDGADLENHHYRWEMNNEAAIDLDRIPMAASLRRSSRRTWRAGAMDSTEASLPSVQRDGKADQGRPDYEGGAGQLAWLSEEGSNSCAISTLGLAMPRRARQSRWVPKMWTVRRPSSLHIQG